MKHCQISWYSNRVDFLGQSIAWSRGLAFHVLEWYLYQIDTKVWQWRTIWLNMFGLKVPDCKLIGWCFSKKDKKILEVLFVGHNATTFFDNLPWLIKILGQNLLQICRIGSSKYIPGTPYLAPHTSLSRFSMTPSDWRRNGCFRHQGVALRQRDRWIWRLEICDALEAENVTTHAHVAVLCSLGIQVWDILGINQFWAIPLFGDLGWTQQGNDWAPKVLVFLYFFHADDWGETAQHGACNVVTLSLKFIQETFPELGLCYQPAQFGFWKVPFWGKNEASLRDGEF